MLHIAVAHSFTLLCGVQFWEYTLSVLHVDGFQFGVTINSGAVNILMCLLVNLHIGSVCT